MRKKYRDYYYIDVDLNEMRIVDWNVVPRSAVVVQPSDSGVYRIFLSKGQFNKFIKAASLE